MYIIQFNMPNGQMPGYLTATSFGLSIARDINTAIGFQTPRQAEFVIRNWIKDNLYRPQDYEIKEL